MSDGYYKYYQASDESGNDFNEENQATKDTVWNTAFQLDVMMQAKNRPDGSYLFPAKTCKDLLLCDPKIENINRWIDPNLGSNKDKFNVECRFDRIETKETKAWTCVEPKKKNITATMDVVDKWRYMIGDLKANEEFPIVYEADEVALRFLRLEHMEVKQKITYFCKNQHAYRNTNDVTGKHFMIKTADNVDIAADETSDMMLKNLVDECNTLDGEEHYATFELSTKKLNSLPIKDIKIKHMGVPTGKTYDPRIEVEVGPICFA